MVLAICTIMLQSSENHLNYSQVESQTEVRWYVIADLRTSTRQLPASHRAYNSLSYDIHIFTCGIHITIDDPRNR